MCSVEEVPRCSHSWRARPDRRPSYKSLSIRYLPEYESVTVHSWPSLGPTCAIPGQPLVSFLPEVLFIAVAALLSSPRSSSAGGFLPNRLWCRQLWGLACGAVGTMIDRLRTGFVTDFIDASDSRVQRRDTAIVCGVALCGLLFSTSRRGRNRKDTADPAPAQYAGGAEGSARPMDERTVRVVRRRAASASTSTSRLRRAFASRTFVQVSSPTGAGERERREPSVLSLIGRRRDRGRAVLPPSPVPEPEAIP